MKLLQYGIDKSIGSYKSVYVYDDIAVSVELIGLDVDKKRKV